MALKPDITPCQYITGSKLVVVPVEVYVPITADDQCPDIETADLEAVRIAREEVRDRMFATPWPLTWELGEVTGADFEPDQSPGSTDRD